MPQQVTQLALEVGRLRDQMFEYRLSTFEAYHALPVTSSPGSEGAPALDHPPDDVPETRWSPHPAEARARSRVLPLIEYGACGTYVIICPQEGELSLVPDTPEWFVWLASLSSFRFTGKYGRFTANL